MLSAERRRWEPGGERITRPVAPSRLPSEGDTDDVGDERLVWPDKQALLGEVKPISESPFDCFFLDLELDERERTIEEGCGCEID